MSRSTSELARAIQAVALLALGTVALAMVLVRAAPAPSLSRARPGSFAATPPPHVSPAPTVIPVVADAFPLDFVRFGGVVYLAEKHRLGRLLTDGDLARVVGRVDYRAEGSEAMYPCAVGGTGDAAGVLEPGDAIYAVGGYAPSFRLAARRGGQLVLYEAACADGARVGADLLDIRDRVSRITVHAHEVGLPELAAIAAPTDVARLVDLVLEAPVDTRPVDVEGRQIWVVFHLVDGTAVARPFWPAIGALGYDTLIFPPAPFGEAVVRALADRSAAGVASPARATPGASAPFSSLFAARSTPPAAMAVGTPIPVDYPPGAGEDPAMRNRPRWVSRGYG